MWESRRDFQRVWKGWEAGFMAFHAFHTLSFPWPALDPVPPKLWRKDLADWASCLAKLHHDFCELRRIVVPSLEQATSIFKTNNDIDDLIDGKALVFQHADDLAEVIG